MAIRRMVCALGFAICMTQAEIQPPDIGNIMKHTRHWMKSYRRMKTSSNSRRLMANVDFSKMCGSACWGDIKSGMISFLTAAETACPAPTPEPCPTPAPGPSSNSSSNSSSRRLNSSSGSDSDCVFDQCSEMANYCADLPGLATMMGAQWDDCMAATFDFFCNGLCSTNCQNSATSSEERKLFCAPDDGGEDEYEEPQCGEEADSGQDAAAMGEMFNFMCLKKPNSDTYCMSKGYELEASGAFSGTANEEFPNPCDVDCSTATGQAIAELGCCMGSLLQISEKYGMMDHAELISAKAATYKCGGNTAMTPCSDDSLILATATVLGSTSVDQCPTTKSETMAKQIEIANALEMKPKNVNILACPRGGTDCKAAGGRRLQSGASIEYSATVTGSASQVAAKTAAVETKAAAIGSATVTQQGGGSSGSSTGSGLVGGSVADYLNLFVGVLICLLWSRTPLLPSY